jgi:hypothetical protein
LIVLACAVVLMACPSESVTRDDVGLSEAGPRLDAGRSLVDAGPAADASVADGGLSPVDAALPLDASSGDEGVALADAGSVDVEGGSDVLSPGDAGAPQPADGGGELDAGEQPAPAVLSGRVSDVLSRNPSLGVRVCVRGQEQAFPCVVTGAGGLYRLRVPSGAPLVVVYDVGTPAIQPTLLHMQVQPGETVWNLVTLQQANVPLMMNLMGQVNEANKGHVTVSVGSAGGVGLPAATTSITPNSGFGPVYLSNGGMPDVNATATSTNGTAAYVNVTPGSLDVRVTPPGTHGCSPYQNSIVNNGAVRLVVLAGHLSVAVFECQPN